ncbi:MAG: hypothetical protein QOE07_186 [Acidimicrobiaceae bacterium]|nr:hypothetical protein [Acidimicrobiaceae bacterium]
MPHVAARLAPQGYLQLRSGLTIAGLCTRLHTLGALSAAARPGEARQDNPIFASPKSLFDALAANPRFRQDSALGSIYHGGRISFREVSPSDSLHVVFDGERVSAHVDLVSPLNFDRERPAQYSPLRVVAHNLTGVAGDLSRLVRRGGRRGRSVESALGVWAG